MGRQRILVTGAGGFIGHHLVKRLEADGHWVRGADLEHPAFEASAADEFELVDLRDPEACRRVVRRIDRVYHLAADTGGAGFAGRHRSEAARNNTLIDVHMLDAACVARVGRLLFASSACVYPRALQDGETAARLRETDALPADPEPGCGWEKLCAEQLCARYREGLGLDTRVARLYNVYGPVGPWEGGRERVAAALCRKVARAANGDSIEVWGDGGQVRSFLYVDDCVEGLLRIMDGVDPEPFNLGGGRPTSVDELARRVAAVAGKRIRLRHAPARPEGARSRCPDDTRMREVLGWEPLVPLEEGLAATYPWIDEQVAGRDRVEAVRIASRAQVLGASGAPASV